MPSQREVRKRRIRAEQVAATRHDRGHLARRRRRLRYVVGAVAVLVVVMMVMSLAGGLFAA